MNLIFPKGSHVMLRKDSKFYYQAPEQVGVVTESCIKYAGTKAEYEERRAKGYECWMTVRWSGGHSDGYRETDLFAAEMNNEAQLHLLRQW